MAKSSYQEGIIKRYYENRDTIALQNLGEISSDLFLCENPKKAAQLWQRARKALSHTDASVEEQARIDKILNDHDVPGLCGLVNDLTAPGRKPASRSGSSKGNAPPPPTSTGSQARPPATTPATTTVDASDPLTLKKAMKAFRKRLKLTRLDEESKLGVGPFSGGNRSGVVAIVAPDSFPTPVWEKLVEQGKLKRAGPGFYALAEP